MKLYCSLAYLHENIEPKVVHRDIKSSNILIDDEFNAKVSDFGLAKLLGAGKSHISTRVMGTFGLVFLLILSIFNSQLSVFYLYVLYICPVLGIIEFSYVHFVKRNI